MKNFEFHAYTDILFGKGQIENLASRISKYGKNVLFVYGGGSIKKNGIYDAVKNLLSDFNITELSGVKPNPDITSVREGVKLAKAAKVDAVLAVGGGSTIDCAKAIAGAFYYEGDAWDIVTDNSKIEKVLPCFAVVTVVGTGSEMNKNAVISDAENNLKLGTSSMSFIPQASVLDPEYTYTVSAAQTAAGTADIMSHVFENYFSDEPGTYIQDKICEAILMTCIKYCPIAIKEPQNYEARANLMWASSLALNGLCGGGKSQSWTCHTIEHEVSAWFDVTHGTALAIITPAWMRYILNEKTVDRFVMFAKNVWGITKTDLKTVKYFPDDTLDLDMAIANKAIDKLEAFFSRCGIPATLSELGVKKENVKDMAKAAVEHGDLSNAYVPLDVNDVIEILNDCM